MVRGIGEVYPVGDVDALAAALARACADPADRGEAIRARLPGCSLAATTSGYERAAVVPTVDRQQYEVNLTKKDSNLHGCWLFINGNNTPRIARIDLTRFETDEILQIPNAAGGHASPFTTPDTKYVVSATRFSLPIPNADVPIDSYKQNFKGTLSFVTADQPGKMDIAFQILMPGYDYDLGHAGKGPSAGILFTSTTASRRTEARAERFAERQGFHRCGEL